VNVKVERTTRNIGATDFGRSAVEGDLALRLGWRGRLERASPSERKAREAGVDAVTEAQLCPDRIFPTNGAGM
jgi:hypothetical protein